MRTSLLALAFAGSLGCGHRAPPPAVEAAAAAATSSDSTPDAALDAALRAMGTGDWAAAVTAADRALGMAPRGDASTVYRATRMPGMGGAFLALLAPPVAPAVGDVTTTLVVSTVWPDLYYVKAYSLLELGRIDEAVVALEEGLLYLPGDFTLSCEYGHILQNRRDWTGAISRFDDALRDIAMLEGSFQPVAGQAPATFWGFSLAQWKGRALRGQGFALVELQRLDDAEAAYRAALAVDPSDRQSLEELVFIRGLRSK